jgi:hypothetical protein
MGLRLPLLAAAAFAMAFALAGGAQCRTDSEDSDGFDLLAAGRCTDHEGSYQGFCIRYEQRDACLGPWLYELVAEGGTCQGTWVDCRSLDYAFCHEGALYSVSYHCAADEAGGRCRASAPALARGCAPYRCAGASCVLACRTGADCVPPNVCVAGSCKGGCDAGDNGAWVDTDADEEHEDECCNRATMEATLYGRYYVEGFTAPPPSPLDHMEVELSILARPDAAPLATIVTSTDGAGRLAFAPDLCISPGSYILRLFLPSTATSTARAMRVHADGRELRVELS